MRCRLALALVSALAAQDQAPGPVKPLTLELRVFNGTEEVTAHSKNTDVIYESLAQRSRREAHTRISNLLASRRTELEVPPSVMSRHLELGGDEGVGSSRR